MSEIKARKVITNLDAVAEAYYVAHLLSTDLAHPALRKLKRVAFDEEWGGKWKATEYSVEGLSFSVSAGHSRHTDGRIRDAYSSVSNALGFAVFCVEHFPNSVRSKVWAHRLADERLVTSTLEPHLKDFFALRGAISPHAIREALLEADLLAKIAA